MIFIFLEALCAIEVNRHERRNNLTSKPSSFSLKDIWGEGFLWGVPKHRRTIEKRMRRKFGHPDYFWKLLKPKTNLIMCNSCGNYYEAGILCGKIFY